MAFSQSALHAGFGAWPTMSSIMAASSVRGLKRLG
jgi:hypothetical protein